MKRALSLALLAIGCVKGNPKPPAIDAAVDDLIGGTIMLPAPCTESVTTQVGATVPVLGTDMLGTDAVPKQIHLGIAGDAATSMVVSWRTGDETTLATTVQYGVAATTESSATGVTFQYATGFNLDDPRVRIHETHLCGLMPDTVYKYRVGGAGMWSPEYSFRTAPLKTDATTMVTAVVIGDTRDGYTDWGTLLQMAQTQATPDVIFFTGDAVTIGQLQDEWDQFFDAAEPVLRTIPMLCAHGNHDTNSVEFFSMNAQPGREDQFGMDYGPIHLTVLNDTPIDPADITGEAKDFLDSDLTANMSAPWKIVMHHQPQWSASTRHGSDTTLRDTWGPVIDAHTVDLVLSGHDHDYERTKPMRGGAPQATPLAGTTFMVAGSAGAELYPNGTDFWTAYSEQTENYAIVRARVGHLEMQAFRMDGSMMDTLTIDKP
jgi:hypothetical protein